MDYSRLRDWVILILLVLLFAVGVSYISEAAITSNTPTSGKIGATGFWKQNVIVDSATDTTCIDARGYSAIFIDVIKTAGTINVDLDRSVEATGANPISIVDDLTASGAKSELVVAPYYCMDVDTCTGCTVTATFYLWTLFDPQ